MHSIDNARLWSYLPAIKCGHGKAQVRRCHSRSSGRHRQRQPRLLPCDVAQQCACLQQALHQALALVLCRQLDRCSVTNIAVQTASA